MNQSEIKIYVTSEFFALKMKSILVQWVKFRL